MTTAPADTSSYRSSGVIRRLLAPILSAMLAMSALATTPAALATTDGRNGRITYSAQLDTGVQLFTIRADGSHVRQLTNRPGEHVNPDWSPNGRQLVYEFSDRVHAGIELIDRDGRHRRNLTPRGFQGQPAFTPDGRHIVFERVTPDFTDDSIWVMRVDGTHLRRITDNPFSETGYDTDPNVSPNGKRISFVRVREPDVEQALFSVRWDGSHLRQLTSYSANVAVKHDWSPDGSHLVLTVNADFADAKKSSNVALVRPDGSGFRRLTHYKGRTVNAFVGSYSPNGRWIVYRLENRQGRGTLPDGSFGLYKIHPDGSDRQLIASLINKPRYIAWGSRPAT